MGWIVSKIERMNDGTFMVSAKDDDLSKKKHRTLTERMYSVNGYMVGQPVRVVFQHEPESKG